MDIVMMKYGVLIALFLTGFVGTKIVLRLWKIYKFRKACREYTS